MGIELMGVVKCDYRLLRSENDRDCGAHTAVEVALSAVIETAGRIVIETTPLSKLPYGWERHPWKGWLCPEHSTLYPKK